jgi:hypothetical protein
MRKTRSSILNKLNVKRWNWKKKINYTKWSKIKKISIKIIRVKIEIKKIRGKEQSFDWRVKLKNKLIKGWK